MGGLVIESLTPRSRVRAPGSGVASEILTSMV